MKFYLPSRPSQQHYDSGKLLEQAFNLSMPLLVPPGAQQFSTTQERDALCKHSDSSVSDLLHVSSGLWNFGQLCSGTPCPKNMVSWQIMGNNKKHPC